MYTGQLRLTPGEVYDGACPERRSCRRGSRLHNAYTGRFISADTIVPEAGNPQALNRYSYVLNNPLRYTDPTGHYMEGIECQRGCPMHAAHPDFEQLVWDNHPEWITKTAPDWVGDNLEAAHARWKVNQMAVYIYLIENGHGEALAKCGAWNDCAEWVNLKYCIGDVMCSEGLYPGGVRVVHLSHRCTTTAATK
jgi:RHS repeat-associated protein